MAGRGINRRTGPAMSMKVFLSALSLFILISVSGQTVSDNAGVIRLGFPVYSQYLQNGLMINPAYAGSRGALSTFISYRMQWQNIEGAPVIQSVSLHSPMKNDRVALGVQAQFMQYGYTKAQSVYATYAYNIRVLSGILSFGLKGGFDRSNSDYSRIFLINPGDPVFSSSEKPYLLPNIGAGVYYYSNKVFAGLSVPQFLSYRKTGTGATEAFHSFNNYELIFSAGGLVTFSPGFKFKPSVLIDYSLESGKQLNQLDLNGNFILGDIIWIGGSWRTTEEVAVGIVQVQINPQLMFGFSYDYPVGKMSPFKTGGTSEFILRYELRYKVSAANPRYF
jgi:type IX secretion system PorP/SprF family membrane protein